MGAAAGARLRLMDLHAHPARVVAYDAATHGIVSQEPPGPVLATTIHGLWQRQRNGDFAVYRIQDGLRLRYPGEPHGGLQLTRTSRIRPAPGRWCTHRWIVTADGHERVIEVIMRFGHWLRFALADPWDAEYSTSWHSSAIRTAPSPRVARTTTEDGLTPQAPEAAKCR
jgi:hypothetical protein